MMNRNQFFNSTASCCPTAAASCCARISLIMDAIVIAVVSICIISLPILRLCGLA